MGSAPSLAMRSLISGLFSALEASSCNFHKIGWGVALGAIMPIHKV